MAYKQQKQELIKMYGKRCMVCGKKLTKNQIPAFHHRIPKSCGGSHDISNGCIVDLDCHCHIHKYKYGSKEYSEIDDTIQRNMSKFKRV